MTPVVTAKTLKVEAGKSGTFPLTYTNTNTANANWPTSGICGEKVVASGTNSAWATWASGVATVKVPTGTKAGKYDITLTGSYDTSGGGSESSKSSATATTKVTVEVADAKKAGGAAAGSLNDVATTAASVVAGVLGGAIFAAAFAPAPTAALNAGGASATASGNGAATE